MITSDATMAQRKAGHISGPVYVSTALTFIRMGKHFRLLILLISANISLFAQITFQKSYDVPAVTDGTFGTDVIQTGDGGFVITGATDIAAGSDKDAYLLKININGDALWAKTYGGIGIEGANAIEPANDGGFIITGYCTNSVSGLSDVYLVRTDSVGDTLWTRTFGGAMSAVGYDIQQTADSGYIITGQANFSGTDTSDVLLIKTNSAGDTSWVKSFGGGGFDAGYSVRQCYNGGYIIAGRTTNSLTSNTDFYLIKADAAGNAEWEKRLGTEVYDEARSLIQTPDKGYLIAGTTDSTFNLYYDYYVIKTDSAGNVLWFRTYGTASDNETAKSLSLTSDGGYIINGVSRTQIAGPTDVYVVKADSLGFLQWSKSFGGPLFDEGSGIQPTNDGGYISVGYEASIVNTLQQRLYLVKMDSAGTSDCNESTPATATNFSASPVSVNIFPQASPQTFTVAIPPSAITSGFLMHTLCTSLEINEYDSKPPITIYPNPANNRITIRSDHPGSTETIEIMDIPGKVLIRKKSITATGNPETTLDIEKLSPGIYLLRVSSGNSTRVSRFIKY